MICARCSYWLLIVLGVIAAALDVRIERFLLCGRGSFVEWLMFDVMVAEQALVLVEAVQQLSLRKPAATLAGAQRRGGYALRAGSDTVGTGELPVTLHFALLAQDARKHPLALCSL